MSLIKSLDQITPADALRVGGKAYNCARLKQAGFPVPDGMAVMADAKGSSALLKNGDRVRLDATQGKVEIIRRVPSNSKQLGTGTKVGSLEF